MEQYFTVKSIVSKANSKRGYKKGKQLPVLPRVLFVMINYLTYIHPAMIIFRHDYRGTGVFNNKKKQKHIRTLKSKSNKAKTLSHTHTTHYTRKR